MQHNRQVIDDASPRQPEHAETELPEAQPAEAQPAGDEPAEDRPPGVELPEDELPFGAVPAAELPAARGVSEGYAAIEVDEFLAELRRSVRRDPPTMAPYEIADQRFKVTRFGRRYALREVDEILDRTQQVLRERHGEDAVANLEGRAPEPRHVQTWWIYLVAVVLVVAMGVFVLTQL